MTALEELTAGMFDALVGEVFQVEASAGSTGMKLIEVKRYAKTPPSRGVKRGEPFSLLFERVSGPELGRELCRLFHVNLSTDLLFLGRVMPPAGYDPRLSYYEAAFG